MPSPVLDDIAHEWGRDLRLSPTGDLGRVNRSDRTRERILRRVLTARGEYLWEPTYGAGLPKRIGQLIDLAKVRAVVAGQMKLEPSVESVTSLVVNEIVGGVAVSVRFISRPDKQPVVLEFTLN